MSPYRVVHHLTATGRMGYSVMKDGRDHPIDTMSSGAKAEFLCQQLAFAYEAGASSQAARVQALERLLVNYLHLVDNGDADCIDWDFAREALKGKP